jgi:GNAT superfamily N-acetyltransferase
VDSTAHVVPGCSAIFISVELVDLPDFGSDDYASIVDGEADPFETDQLGIAWRGKSGHVGLTVAGQLIAHAGWVPARARTTTGELVELLGLGGVLVHREHRRNGAGRQLVSGAMTRMRDLGTPLGLLFCRTDRVPFYESLGWYPMQNEVIVDQPVGPILMPLVTCWTALVDGAPPPGSELHLEGLPF